MIEFFGTLEIIPLTPLQECLENQPSEDDAKRAQLKELVAARTPEGLEEVHDYMKAIVRRDLRMVDLSDFIVASLEVTKPTFGSVHEIIMASIQRKPLFIHVAEGDRIPLWLLGFIPPERFYRSLDAIKEELTHLANGTLPMDFKYWRILKPELR